jgi:hypothetical protein
LQQRNSRYHACCGRALIFTVYLLLAQAFTLCSVTSSSLARTTPPRCDTNMEQAPVTT